MADQASKSYEEFVRFRQQRNPCISGLSSFLATKRIPQSSCQLYAVDYSEAGGNVDRVPSTKKIHHVDLPSVLVAPPPDQGRVIIIEDLDPVTLETLGGALDIDPIFFAGYVLTKMEDTECSPAPPSAALTPSQILSQEDWFHIHYQQVINLGSKDDALGPIPWVLKTSGNVPRSVRRLPLLQGQQLGIARGCCSILTKWFSQSWIGIVLVDSTASDIVSSSDSSGDPQLRLRRVPHHNGFEDFEKPPSFSSFRSSESRLRSNIRKGSLLEQILVYFSEHPPLSGRAPPSLLALAYYPLRIIVGEWMLYIQLTARFLKHYEYSTNHAGSKFYEDQMVELQKWRLRAIETQFKLNATRELISYRSTGESKQGVWELLLKDLDHLSRAIEQYGQSFERIIPVVTPMVQLLDHRRTVIESVYIKRLTYIAVVFVPLSWIAALFSMANEFGPGQPNFWVYFVVSVPFCFIILIGSLAMPTSWTWTWQDAIQSVFNRRKRQKIGFAF